MGCVGFFFGEGGGGGCHHQITEGRCSFLTTDTEIWLGLAVAIVCWLLKTSQQHARVSLRVWLTEWLHIDSRKDLIKVWTQD